MVFSQPMGYFEIKKSIRSRSRRALLESKRSFYVEPKRAHLRLTISLWNPKGVLWKPKRALWNPKRVRMHPFAEKDPFERHKCVPSKCNADPRSPPCPKSAHMVFVGEKTCCPLSGVWGVMEQLSPLPLRPPLSVKIIVSPWPTYQRIQLSALVSSRLHNKQSRQCILPC